MKPIKALYSIETVVTMDMPDAGIYQNLVGTEQTHVGIYHTYIYTHL